MPNFRLICTLLATSSLTLISNAAADDFANFESRIKHDDNVGNSRVRYAVADTVVANTLRFGRIIDIGEDPYLLTFNGKINNQTYHRLDGLNQLAVGVGVDLKKKLGLGPYAPIVAANINFERQQFQQEDKNLNVQVLELRASKRVWDELNLSIHASTERRHAADNNSVKPGLSGAVYDGSNRQLSLNADYTCWANSILSLQYSIRRGDLVVSTITNSAAIINVAKAIRPDPAFGSDRDAYKVEGEIKSLGLSFTYPLTARWELQLDRQQHQSTVVNGVKYDRHAYSLAARYQF